MTHPHLRAALAMHDGANRVLSDALHETLQRHSIKDVARDLNMPVAELSAHWERVRGVDLVGEA